MNSDLERDRPTPQGQHEPQFSYICEAGCHYGTASGLPCKHAVGICLKGAKVDWRNLVPYRFTTQCWRTQYPQSVSFLVPTDAQMEEISDSALELRAEHGLASENSVLKPVAVHRKGRGRPPSNDRKKAGATRKRKSTQSAGFSQTGHLVRKQAKRTQCAHCGKWNHSTARCPEGRQEFYHALMNPVVATQPANDTADSIDQVIALQAHPL